MRAGRAGLLPAALSVVLALTGCGGIALGPVGPSPTPEQPKRFTRMISTSPDLHTTPTPTFVPIVLTPTPTAKPTMTPFPYKPYSPPGAPSTLSAEDAQATRTAFEQKIADDDQEMRTLHRAPPDGTPTPRVNNGPQLPGVVVSPAASAGDTAGDSNS